MRQYKQLTEEDRIEIYAMKQAGKQQSTRSQRPDLQRWIDSQDSEKLDKVLWYQDKFTGKTMERPGWQKLQGAIDRGEIGCVVCWRLDRLGRTASGLCKLFEDFQAKKVRLISLKDSIDLGTASGRLIATYLLPWQRMRLNCAPNVSAQASR